MSDTAELLAQIPPLGNGSHKNISEGACIMEAVAWIAHEPWSDHPQCACPVIGAFLRNWNDGLSDDERDTLLRPLIPLLVGTKVDEAIERRRSLMAADWLVREHTPAWLRLAGLTTQADALASLPEITDMAQCPSLMPTLNAVRSDAAAVRDAARAAVRDAAGDAAWDAVWDAAWDAARVAAWAAVRAAARDAAWAAAGAAAGDALKSTKLELQQSALRLVHRMIACGAEEPA